MSGGGIQAFQDWLDDWLGVGHGIGIGLDGLPFRVEFGGRIYDVSADEMWNGLFVAEETHDRGAALAAMGIAPDGSRMPPQPPCDDSAPADATDTAQVPAVLWWSLAEASASEAVDDTFRALEEAPPEVDRVHVSRDHIVSVTEYDRACGGRDIVTRLVIHPRSGAPVPVEAAQSVKRALLGDVEGVALFPCDARAPECLTSGELTLWCLPPGQTFPVGPPGALPAGMTVRLSRMRGSAPRGLRVIPVGEGSPDLVTGETPGWEGARVYLWGCPVKDVRRARAGNDGWIEVAVQRDRASGRMGCLPLPSSAVQAPRGGEDFRPAGGRFELLWSAGDLATRVLGGVVRVEWPERPAEPAPAPPQERDTAPACPAASPEQPAPVLPEAEAAPDGPPPALLQRYAVLPMRDLRRLHLDRLGAVVPHGASKVDAARVLAEQDQLDAELEANLPVALRERVAPGAAPDAAGTARAPTTTAPPLQLDLFSAPGLAAGEDAPGRSRPAGRPGGKARPF